MPAVFRDALWGRLGWSILAARPVASAPRRLARLRCAGGNHVVRTQPRLVPPSRAARCNGAPPRSELRATPPAHGTEKAKFLSPGAEGGDSAPISPWIRRSRPEGPYEGAASSQLWPGCGNEVSSARVRDIKHGPIGTTSQWLHDRCRPYFFVPRR
jgi:hypothetical protein